MKKIESVYNQITFLQDEEPKTPQITDEVIQLESPYVIKEDTFKISETVPFGDNHQTVIKHILFIKECNFLVAGEYPTIK